MSESSSSPQTRWRLIKRPAEHSIATTPTKRFKSTGVEFELRKLTYDDKKQTNDEIHQSIELCPVMRALVDTEAFQRLRHIKQLGTSEYLYTCANGNRFQHSLGVAHLAEKMCKNIKDEQPMLGTTHKDVLCVKLAGLLHDIGHGPFSHGYEGFRLSALPAYLEANPDLKNEAYQDCKHLVVPKGWSHEMSSLQMIDAALGELGLAIDLDNLDQPLRQIGNGIDASSMRVFKPRSEEDSVLTSRDFVFIKECILGEPLPEVRNNLDNDSFIGRTAEGKEWLYDIVNNRHSGLDVDKVDYFSRDHLRAMGAVVIDTKMIEDARVARVFCEDEQRHRCRICYPLKHVAAIMNFFKKRFWYHTVIYQHKKTVATASMLCDILCSADPHFRLEVDGEKYPMSRAVVKSKYLMHLDDNVLRDIARSKDEELSEARALYHRFRRHDIYKCAVDKHLDIEGDTPDRRRDEKVWKMSDREIKQGMIKTLASEWKQNEALPLEANDFTVEKMNAHHGKKANNPLLGVRFFEKMSEKLDGPIENLPVAEQVVESEYKSIIPDSFQQLGLRIFTRSNSKRDLVNQVFHQWFERVGRDDEVGDVLEATPSPRVKLEVYEGSDDEDGDDQEENSSPVMLSQESVDGDDEDDRRQAHAQLDQSPIPVRSR